MFVEQYVFRPLDMVRAQILSYTLRVEVFRAIFESRYFRSLLLLVISFVLNAFLMLHFPLWTLLLVPSLLGVPHLIESLRSFHQTASPIALKNDAIVIQKSHSLLFLSCGIFGIFRLLSLSEKLPGMHTLSIFVQQNFRILDFAIVLGSFFAFLRVYAIAFRSRWKSIVGIIGVGILMHKWPDRVWGILIFSHNFMAFRYWHFYAPNKEEKRLCLVTLGLFIAMHLWVLFGYMDGILSVTPVDQSSTKLFGYSFSQVSLDLFPALYDLDLSRKIVMLLCFGQGIHYVIWIKIIPECRLQLKRPIPFRMAFRRLKLEWGEQKAYWSAFLLVGFFLMAFLIRWDWINNVFFAIAFYHIYAEYLAFMLREDNGGIKAA